MKIIEENIRKVLKDPEEHELDLSVEDKAGSLID